MLRVMSSAGNMLITDGRLNKKYLRVSNLIRLETLFYKNQIMRHLAFFLTFLLATCINIAQDTDWITPFEESNGLRTATYDEMVD